jgi:GT2 family glycosyltransferase
VSGAGPAPAISVVVPTVGRPRNLERCLAALARSQMDRELFEVVVVDDSADPETAGVARSAEVGARVVRAARTGPSGARNAGAAAAEGEFVAFTDDDCEPRAEWLPALERALRENLGAAVGGVTVNGIPGSAPAAASQAVVDAVHAQFNRDPDAPRFFASSNIAFPAEEFRSFGGFDERFRYAEDRELCERWLRTGHRFVSAPDAVVDHMRTFTLREFWRQHYGYGRGAAAYARARGDAGYRADRVRILGEIAARTTAGDPSLAMLLVLSQAATVSGYARESIAARLGRGGGLG